MPRSRRILLLVVAFLLFAGVQAVANVGSTRADYARVGIVETAAHVWIWELTAIAMWLVLLPAIAWLVARLRPPRMAWGWALAGHALATIPLSAVHIAGMLAMRVGIYAAMGERYGFGGVAERFLYEYRKDVVSYLLLAAFVAFAQWFLARPEAGEGEAGVVGTAPRVLEVPDGNVTHLVPVVEIDWLAAAGNYVEIAWGARVLLHRATLAAMAEQLGPGFVRIHRSRLVRRAAITAIETDRSGDFTVTLGGGAALRGSRRYRGAL